MRCHTRFAAERLIEYITLASDEFRDAAATGTIQPALCAGMARDDTLLAYAAGFYESPTYESRVRAVSYVAVADSFTPSVSSLLAAARPQHVVTTAGLTRLLAPPTVRGIVSRQSLERTAVAVEYFARPQGPISSSTSSSSSRPAPTIAR